MSDAADKRQKAMVAAYDPDGEDPATETDMKDLAVVLDAWVAETDFIELVEEMPDGTSFHRAWRFAAVPRAGR